MAHEIKIKGNFTNITQGFKNLSDSISLLSKKKPKLNVDDSDFSKMIKTMSNDISKNQDYLEKRIKNFSIITARIYKDLQKSYENSTDTKKVEQLENEYKNFNKILAESINNLKILNQSQQAFSSFGQQKIGGFLQRLPSPRGIAGGVSRALGPAGLTIGATGVGLGAIYGLGSTRRQIVEEGLQLRAFTPRTAQGVESIRETGIRTGTGYTPIESIRQAVELERRIGISSGVQRRELGGRTSLEQAQRLGRGFGIDVNQIAGFAGQLRSAGLTGGESLRKLRDIFIQGTALGVERSRLPEFAQAQIGYLEQQASQGEVSIKGLESINSLLSRNRFFADDPRRGLNIVQGLERGFQQQNGPGALAAFQTIQDITGGTSPFQAIAMKRRGLLRTLERMEEQGQIKDINEGLEKFINNLAKLKLGKDIDVNKLEKGTDDFLATALAIQDITGLDFTLVEQMLSAMKGDAKVTKDWIKSKIDAADKSKNILEKVMKSQDMNIQMLSSKLQEFKMDTGDIANAITAGLHKFVDDVLTSFKNQFLNMVNFDPTKSGIDKLKSMQQAAMPEAQSILSTVGGDRRKAIEIARENLIKKQKEYKKASSGFFGIGDEKSEKLKELKSAGRIFESLLGRRVKSILNEDIVSKAKFDEKYASSIEEIPKKSIKQEGIDLLGKDIQKTNQEFKNFSKENTRMSFDEEEKIKGRKPAKTGSSDVTDNKISEQTSIPGTNILVTPMNRLKDSIDKLTDVMIIQVNKNVDNTRRNIIRNNIRVR